MGRDAGWTLKICHLITRLIIGGAQENTLLTCSGQSAAGHSVTLVSGPSLGPEGDIIEHSRGWPFRFLAVPHLRRSIDPARDFLAFWTIWYHLRRENPDILHTHSAKAGILGRLAAGLLPRRPLVVHTIHGLPFHPHQSRPVNRFYILLEKMAAPLTDAYISVARAMTIQSLEAGIGRPDRYRTVYSAFDTASLASAAAGRRAARGRLGFADDEFVIGKIARLFELKGHQDLLPAFAGLRRTFPRARLLLVGDGLLRPRLEAMVRDLGLGGSVVFAGLVPPGDIPGLIGALDLLVHASLREGLPRAVSQAMAAGVPVVASDTDGTGEIVLDGSTGRLFPPGDAAALEAALSEALGSPGRTAAMARAGRRLVLEQFSLETMISGIDSVYREFLERSSRGGRKNHPGPPGFSCREY